MPLGTQIIRKDVRSSPLALALMYQGNVKNLQERLGLELQDSSFPRPQMDSKRK